MLAICTRIGWRGLERVLLAILLFGKAWLLWHRWNMFSGYDVDRHLEMVNLLRWTNIDVDMHTIFYGYHPPLAFLFARAFLALGFTDVEAVQLVSFVSSLVAFFFLRATLQKLHLLNEPLGVAFLYLTAAIPLSVFLSVSVNMDVIILAYASIVLYLSVCLFWVHIESAQTRRLLSFGIVATIGLALLTKFSGILLLALPCLVALFRNGWRARIAGLTRSAVIASIAITLVLPYYLTRYYIPEGTFFPRNGDWMITADVVAAREARDKDPVRFFGNLFTPKLASAEDLQHHDWQTPRLSDTWKDFWIADQTPLVQPDRSIAMSFVYLRFVPWLLLLGMLLILRRSMRGTAWLRFAGLFTLFSLLHLAALIYYSYENPYADWKPTKAIYIAPTLWLVSFLLAQLLEARSLAPLALARRWKGVQAVMLIGIGALILLNHTLPNYVG
jgi:hypothetical protein